MATKSRRAVYFPYDAFSKATDYKEAINMLLLPEPAGLYDEDLHSLQDWDFAIRAARRGWKTEVFEQPRQARIHKGSISANTDKFELFGKYPFMRGYILLNRFFDAFVLLLTNPRLFVKTNSHPRELVARDKSI